MDKEIIEMDNMKPLRNFFTYLPIIFIFSSGVITPALANEPVELPSFEEWIASEEYEKAMADIAVAQAMTDLADAAAAIASEKPESSYFEQTLDSAQRGNVEDQNQLAIMYFDGEDLPQNYHKAFEWSEKASKQGNSSAQLILATLYIQGKGVRQDYSLGRKWLLEAASQGNAGAQGYLGEIYEYGTGVRQDKIKAKEWYGKSCDNGLQVGCDLYRKLNQK